jgi:hypothetical protein
MEHLLNLIKLTHFNFILAYIDAGTGSIIIQVVIASLAGGAFAVKIFWKKITGRLKRSPKTKLKEDDKVEK